MCSNDISIAFNISGDVIESIKNESDYCGYCKYFGDRIQCPYFDIAKANKKWNDIPCNNFY